MSQFFNFNFERILGQFSIKRNIKINNGNFFKIKPQLDLLLDYINELKSSTLVLKEKFEFPLNTLTSSYITINNNLRVKVNQDNSIHLNFLDFKDLSDTIFKFVDVDDNHSELNLEYVLSKTGIGVDQEKYDVLEFFIDSNIVSNIKIVTF